MRKLGAKLKQTKNKISLIFFFLKQKRQNFDAANKISSYKIRILFVFFFFIFKISDSKG